MKEVIMNNGRRIQTPWLRIDEAAAYCGISRSTFDEKACGLPHGGDKRTRLYHCNVLDAWMEGQIQDVPFTREKIAPRRQRIRVMETGASGGMDIVDPVTGKVY